MSQCAGELRCPASPSFRRGLGFFVRTLVPFDAFVSRGPAQCKFEARDVPVEVSYALVKEISEVSARG